eukprot:12636788-Ditylum_brightwellii.AAC.1
MEPLVPVEITEKLHNLESGMYLSHITIDNDGTTMAQLQHKSDGSFLGDDIPVPTQRGDMGHRMRGLGR